MRVRDEQGKEIIVNTFICLCGAMAHEDHSIHCPFPCYDWNHRIVPEWKALRDKSIWAEYMAAHEEEKEIYREDDNG